MGWIFKYGVFIIFGISLIGLNIAIGNHIISNKLVFKGNVESLQNKIDTISNTDKQLTSEELTELKDKLKTVNLNTNALIVNQSNTINFELNKQNSTYDGFIIFTFVATVILFICISLICLLANPFGSMSDIFDLSSDLIYKIIFILLIFVPFIGLVFASIMYPSCLSKDVPDSIILSSTISPSFGAIISIILSIIFTIKGGSDYAN